MKKIKKKAAPSTPLKLDLGCGPHKRDGFTGVDRISFPGVDLIVDLCAMENVPEDKRKWSSPVTPQYAAWPWEKESVEEVHCSHFLEHLTNDQRVHFYNELYRVLKPGAKASIIVPHWSSGRAYGDPTHQWPPVVEFSFYYLDKGWRDQNAPHCGLTCDFLATWGFSIHPGWQAKNQETQMFAMNHYREVAQDLMATLVKR